MPENFLETKSKAHLFTFFLLNPERSFYIGELKKKVGGSKLQQDLQSFVRSGFVEGFSKSGLRYYKFNKRNPLIPQIRKNLSKELARNERKFQDELHKLASKISGLKVAVLSGLFAANPHLECDMLLVGRINSLALNNFIKKVQRMVGQEINYALLTLEEYQFRKNIFDRFLKDIFENKHVVLVDKARAKK